MTITITEMDEVREVRTYPKSGGVQVVPGEFETRQQRRERHAADREHVTMKQIAAMAGISHNRVKELNSDRGKAQRVLADPDATVELKAIAEGFLKEAIPNPHPDNDRAKLWEAHRIWAWLERTHRVDIWHEPRRKEVPGVRTKVDRVGK